MSKKAKYIAVILLLIVLLGIIGYFGYRFIKRINEENKEKKLVVEIKESYNQLVEVTKEKEIYKKENKEYKKVGTVSKGITIELAEVIINDSSDIYFPIKNTDYYIDYLNLKKAKEKDEDSSLDHYLVTKEVTTNPTILYKYNEVAFNLEDSYTFDVLATNDNKHYVKYLDSIYTVNNNYSLVDKVNSENILTKISVLSFSDDINSNKLEEVLKHLSSDNYNSISITDFKLWINGSVNLPEKSVLLISYKELSEDNKKIVSNYKMNINTNLETIEFTSGDNQLKVGDSKYYKYEVLSSTSLDRVKNMLKGIKEVKVSTAEVAVLNYHFFYDSNTEVCDESICISTDNFRKQLSYLRDNGYKTLTMQEFNDWIDGKISVPTKSVLITVDDGAAGTFTHLPQILNEYKMHATLFLISGWWPVSRYQSSPYLEIQSHTHKLHDSNYCDNDGCGYKTLKLSKDEIKADLQESIDTIGTNLAFCYPFYQTNSNLVQAVKESGFKLGFVGGNKKAKRSSNKYYLPRYVIYKNTSLKSFINMIS